jgi:hypothetical protein
MTVKSRARELSAGAVVLFLAALLTAAPDAALQVPPAAEKPAAPQELTVDGRVVGRRTQTRAGEICKLCNNPVTADDPTYMVGGHRMAVHSEEVTAGLGAQLLRLASQLRPRGAFLGASPEQAGLSPMWFYGGLYVLAGLVFAALSAHRALHTGHHPLAWFLLGLAFSVAAYAALRALPRREVRAPAGVPRGLRKIAATYEPQLCACGAQNHPSATECTMCGAKLEAKTVSEVTRAGLAAR